MIRLKLGISYDGSAFSGWAVQPGQRTVAGAIHAGLETLLREPVPMVVAGRTDAGVHASGQVAHIDVDPVALAALTPRRHVPADGATAESGTVGLLRRLAGVLPADVRVRSVELAPDGFDARFAAMRRHYCYRVISSQWGLPPLRRVDACWWRRPLDAAAMHAAAQPLVGLHDFAAFCKPRAGATTIRQLQRVTVRGSDVGGAHLVEIFVSADAFCHCMVRSLVGALLAVGEGRSSVDRPAELLQRAVRSSEIGVAPACGLTLLGVDYPPDSELAARVAQTRAVRVRSDAVDATYGPGAADSSPARGV